MHLRPGKSNLRMPRYSFQRYRAFQNYFRCYVHTRKESEGPLTISINTKSLSGYSTIIYQAIILMVAVPSVRCCSGLVACKILYNIQLFRENFRITLIPYKYIIYLIQWSTVILVNNLQYCFLYIPQNIQINRFKTFRIHLSSNNDF